MERTLKHELSIALERLLVKKGINKQQLAHLVGVHPSEVSKWFKDHNFTLDTIERIEKATGEYLIGIML